MPKRKSHMRLPSGWGSIRFLGNNRRLPYAVHPPAKERDALGHYIRPAAICYVPDWYTGFAVLSAYHAGTYEPGLELTISREVEGSTANLDAFCKRVLKDRGMAVNAGLGGPTFKEIYDLWFEWKFGKNAPKKMSASAKDGYSHGFAHLEAVHDVPIDQITLDRLQKIVNDCPLSRRSRANIVMTAKVVYEYAIRHHLCQEDVSAWLVVPDSKPVQSGVPFSESDLSLLWANKDQRVAEMLLIMCYSGFRISAYYGLEVNLKDRYFKGGVKTDAGKGRIVPIHSAIYPLVEHRMKEYGCLLPVKQQSFRESMDTLMRHLQIKADPKHTPHDCRHTFSMLCERYGVREADRKRLMGHSFGSDITNGVYGHRTVEELRTEIEKIQLPKLEKI